MLEQASDLGVIGNVALEALRAGQRFDQVLGLQRQPLVLVGEGQARTGRVQLLRDGPGDAALVGDSEDNRGTSFEQMAYVIRSPREPKE